MLGAAAALLVLTSSVHARAADEVSVAVGGRNIIAYLPLPTLADELGYFKDAGVEVTINDVGSGTRRWPGAPKSAAALEIGFGSYEHVLHLRPKGIDVVLITLFNHTYGVVAGLDESARLTIRSPKDLKGLRMGVIAPGSSMSVALQLLLAKDGLGHDDVSVIGVGAGAGAIAAMKSGSSTTSSMPIRSSRACCGPRHRADRRYPHRGRHQISLWLLRWPPC